MNSVRVPAKLRRKVEQRAQGCCEYCRCQARFTSQSFCVEHIAPRSLGGTTEYANLAFACHSCNNHKYNKVTGSDPGSKQLFRLFHPRRDIWSHHFAWSDDFCQLIGRTPIGRATVDALNMNKPGIVRLRAILLSIGEHPPPTS